MNHPAEPIKLYSSRYSGHAHRVRLFLSLLDLPYEIVEVDLRAKANRSPDFLAKNPLGQVPVIEDGDVLVYDSNAILVYLATRYDDGVWLPREAIAAATVQRWLGMAAGPVTYGPNRARLATRFKAPVDLPQAQSVAERFLVDLDRELAGRAFALGSAPTIADVAVYSYVALAPEGGVSLEPYANVRAWLARVEALPRFVAPPRTDGSTG